MITEIFLRIWFVIISVLVILISSLTLSIISIFSTFIPNVDPKEYSRIILTLVTRTGLALLPHIDVIDYSKNDDTWNEAWDEMLHADEPAIILMNHNSYLDSVILLSLMPTRISRKCSFLAMAKLFEVPVLGQILKTCGFFPIHPKEDLLYKEKQEKVLDRINQHTDEGGILAFFPEGKVNVKPEKLLPFRYGGMEMARKNSNLWAFVHKGMENSWPYEYVIGGFSSKIKYKLVRIPKYDENLTIEEYSQEVQNFMQSELDSL